MQTKDNDFKLYGAHSLLQSLRCVPLYWYFKELIFLLFNVLTEYKSYMSYNKAHFYNKYGTWHCSLTQKSHANKYIEMKQQSSKTTGMLQ